jgi:hypothetical protein
MARGTDTITVQGVLTPGRDCCVYALRARAGQVMTWRLAGASARTGILYPNRQAKGPGLPPSIPLPQNGVYMFGVAPSLTSDTSEPFRLTFTIR